MPERQVLKVTGSAPNNVPMPTFRIDIALFEWMRQNKIRFTQGPIQKENAFSDIVPQDWAYIFDIPPGLSLALQLPTGPLRPPTGTAPTATSPRVTFDGGNDSRNFLES